MLTLFIHSPSICLEGPLIVESLSPVPPSNTPLSWSRILEGLFELTDTEYNLGALKPHFPNNTPTPLIPYNNREYRARFLINDATSLQAISQLQKSLKTS